MLPRSPSANKRIHLPVDRAPPSPSALSKSKQPIAEHNWAVMKQPIQSIVVAQVYLKAVSKYLCPNAFSRALRPPSDRRSLESCGSGLELSSAFLGRRVGFVILSVPSISNVPQPQPPSGGLDENGGNLQLLPYLPEVFFPTS